MKEEVCFKTLTERDRLVKVIDARKTKTAVMFNLGCFVLTIAVFCALFFPLLGDRVDAFMDHNTFVYSFLFLVATGLYLILHELVHGFFYKVFTGEKLTFGMTFTCAYCGVKGVYVQKKYALIASLAPFVLFTIFFGILIVCSFYFFNEAVSFWLILLMSLHIGGCVGDFYAAVLLLTMKGNIYVCDEGPRQEFYRRENRR